MELQKTRNFKQEKAPSQIASFWTKKRRMLSFIGLPWSNNCPSNLMAHNCALEDHVRILSFDGQHRVPIIEAWWQHWKKITTAHLLWPICAWTLDRVRPVTLKSEQTLMYYRLAFSFFVLYIFFAFMEHSLFFVHPEVDWWRGVQHRHDIFSVILFFIFVFCFFFGGGGSAILLMVHNEQQLKMFLKRLDAITMPVSHSRFHFNQLPKPIVLHVSK